jgi:hypothetical protein
MGVQDQPDPVIIDSLLLMRAFFKIADDRDTLERGHSG